MAALPDIEGEIPKRVFSLQVLGNSKSFEGIEGALVRALKEFYPGAETRDDLDKKEILAEFGIVDNPQYVYLSGKLTIEAEGALLDLGVCKPALGLPVEMIRGLKIAGLDARVILSVENLTSFYQLAKARPNGVLLVYLGGYHNRHRRQVFLALKEFMDRSGKEIKFAHWGDIDFGGFSILVDLERKTGLELAPVAMDERILARYRGRCGSFDSKYGEKLRGLLEKPGFARFCGVIELMLKERCRLEQEGVEIGDVLGAIGQV